MIIEIGARSVAYSTDETSARYPSTTSLRRAVPAQPAVPATEPVRALVELRLRQGGMAPRALLGGEFVPGDGAETRVEVMVADEPLGLGKEATCASELGKPLVAGLPDEFANAVLDGLTTDRARELPAGILRVDRAGHDEVDSTPVAFQLVSELLHRALVALANGAEPAGPVREHLARHGL